MWKTLSHQNYTTPPACEVAGSTLTVPGLAPSLIELLEANLAGEGLPMVGQPMFDDSEAQGEARTEARQNVISDVFNTGFELEEEHARADAEAQRKKEAEQAPSESDKTE